MTELVQVKTNLYKEQRLLDTIVAVLERKGEKRKGEKF